MGEQGQVGFFGFLFSVFELDAEAGSTRAQP